MRDGFSPPHCLVGSRGLILKLNVAFLGNRRLLGRDHLALHLSELGGCLLIAADEECRGPKDDHSRRRC